MKAGHVQPNSGCLPLSAAYSMHPLLRHSLAASQYEARDRLATRSARSYIPPQPRTGWGQERAGGLKGV